MNRKIVWRPGRGWERLSAADAAFHFLVNKFDPKTSTAIATRVELLTALRWEEEQEEMRKRRERCRVFEISIEGMEQARQAFAKISPGQSDAGGEKYVFGLLTKFLPDEAWWIAKEIRREVLSWWRMRNECVA